jgi:LysM repeat protein
MRGYGCNRSLAGVLKLLAGVLLCLFLAMPAQAHPAGEQAPGPFSLALLGTYRKVMEIEDEVTDAARRHGVDPLLARALCLYESGGNANLTSSAGAKGYLQVMPATFRRMGVKTNIEAGLKYLGQQIRRFEREDLALAAYNAGPGTVLRGRRIPLETTQYVLGIGNFKNILQRNDAEIRRQASRLRLAQVQENDTWWSISRRTGRSVLLLRMYNPFLARRPLRPAWRVAYPPELEMPPVQYSGESLRYVSRPGDQYLFLAGVFGVTPDRIREANHLWHVDLVLPDTPLEIPLEPDKPRWADHQVLPGQDLGGVAASHGVSVWDLIRDNRLWEESLEGVATVRVDVARKVPRYARYKVRRGDTLTGIARRHAIALDDLRRANGFSKHHSRIRVGEVLRIPLS